MGKQTARKRLSIDKQERIWQALLKKTSEDRIKNNKKKKSYTEMLDYFNFPQDIKDYVIRKPEAWVPKSFNFDRQCKSFIDHLFVKYPVPNFMYQIFQTELNAHAPRDDYRPRWGVPRVVRKTKLWTFKTVLQVTWFMCLAQGGSFYKESKGILTKKEALMFLNSTEDLDIESNILLAKCRVKGLKDSISKHIIRVLFSGFFITGSTYNTEKTLTIINFYSKVQEYLDEHTLTEITDYIRSELYRHNGFSLKGRTITSVINLSNRWHQEQVLISKAAETSKGKWQGFDIEDWKFIAKVDTNITWSIKQIKTAKGLAAEGRAHHHCVGSYCNRCANGSLAIFTMESSHTHNYERKKHITIEVGRDFKVYQMRGQFNKLPSNFERKIIKRWSLDRGLKV